jgi:hypothetical protein
MCPLCAARYKYVCETEPHALIEKILGLVVPNGKGSVELSVVISGSRTSLRFTGTHAIDLQSALRGAGEERG